MFAVEPSPPRPVILYGGFCSANHFLSIEADPASVRVDCSDTNVSYKWGLTPAAPGSVR